MSLLFNNKFIKLNMHIYYTCASAKMTAELHHLWCMTNHFAGTCRASDFSFSPETEEEFGV